MPSSLSRYLYLPWMRQGLLTSANIADSLGDDLPARLTMRVQLMVNNVEAAVMPVHFYGPGDVLGIDPREIVRTEPRPNLPNFEPNLFPFIEFDRPDFPWLFTPAKANSDGRLRPWLCLVVVPKGDDVYLTVNPHQPLPVLECPLAALPDLSDSWAWAHTQLTTTSSGSGSDVEEVLRRYPERTVSRLLCPRRLDSGVSYLACLVPAFAVGRKTGLGEMVTAEDEAGLKPAWPVPTESTDPLESVSLPVYYHWEFLTGPAGDFEALVRRLEVRILPDKVGVQRVAVHAPGWGIQARSLDAPGAVLEVAGMLSTPTTDPAPWPQEAADYFQERLRAIMDGPADADGSPVVKPPLYGQEYTQTPALPEEDGTPHWLRELNLDPRYRLAAGLGTMVVRFEQERLMASAWSQLAAAEKDVQAQRRAEFGEAISSALTDKHLPGLVAPAAAAATPPAQSSMQAMEMSAFSAVAQGKTAVVEEVKTAALISHANGSLARRLQLQGLITTTNGNGHMDSASQAMMALSAAQEETPPAPTGPFRFAPTFPQPMVEMLRNYFPYMLLPNLAQVPPNTIALLETNPAFVEAFMVGLNHEMGRELLWREFPVDRRGTYFQNFWSDSGQISIPDDLSPIAEWLPESRLGDHLQTGLEGSGESDPDLEAQIQAAQAAIGAIVQQIAGLEFSVADLTAEREGAAAAGQPTRDQLSYLYNQKALIQTKQFEKSVAEQAVESWNAQALVLDEEAAEVRESVNAQREQLEELLVIAAQIPALEAQLQAVLDEIAGYTAQIATLNMRDEQIPAEIAAAQATGEAAQQHLSSIQYQISTIPDLQNQGAAADQEAADFQAQAQSFQAQAAAVRAQADPARQRLAELDAMEAEIRPLMDKIDALELEIRDLELVIAEHKANQPPAPPDLPPPDDKGGNGDTPPIIIDPNDPPPESFGPIIMPDPYEDYYEWLKRLEELEAELSSKKDELLQLSLRLTEIDAALLERPTLQAEVDAAEQAAAPYDQEATLALQAAATATASASYIRNRIVEIEQLAATIPTIEAEIQTAEETILSLQQELAELPAQIAAVEAQRTEAEGRVGPAQAAIDAVMGQLEEMPALQAQVDAAEAQAVGFENQAAAAREEAQLAQAIAETLEDEIADLVALTADIPTVEAEVQMLDEALAALSNQIEATQSQLAGQIEARDAAHSHLWQLVTERTMRFSQLVLLIRGDLLRRFARASIYAVEAEWANVEHTQRRIGTSEIYPIFRESWGNDLTFLGFSLTGQTARGSADHPGWYFVIQEQPTEPRFGLDAAEGVGRPVEEITAWDSLSWDDMVANPDELINLVYIPVDGRLSGEERPSNSSGQSPTAAWGRTSAHMAVITQQKPVRMAVHASVWLPQAAN